MTEMNTEKIEFLKTLLEFGVIREQAPGEIKDLCAASRKLELPFAGLSDDSGSSRNRRLPG